MKSFQSYFERVLNESMPQGGDPERGERMNRDIAQRAAQDNERSPLPLSRGRPGGYDEPSNPQSSTTLTIDDRKRADLKAWLNSPEGKRFATERTFVWKIAYPNGKLNFKKPIYADYFLSALKTYAGTDFNIKRDTNYSY